MSSIPVIDLSAPHAQVVVQVGAACETAGFFYVVGHGHATSLRESVYAMSERLFALPPAAKAALHLRHSTCRRGFEAIGDQTLDVGDDAALPDQKESYYCGPDHPADHPYVVKGYDSYGTSQWPEIDGFRDTMLAYIGAHDALCRRIMGLMAEHMGLAGDFFEPMLTDPMITLRLLRYPPHPANAPPKLFGAGAHTDWGGITTLAQDEIGGLQVQLPSGAWVDAPPLDDSYVVNLGDLIPRWSNGRFKSNPHRVINKASDRARYSIPFFYTPNYEAQIEALPGTTGPDKPWAYTPCTAGGHLHEMFLRTYVATAKPAKAFAEGAPA
jgi:isopenicillin N synthase-like dioxygenase